MRDQHLFKSPALEVFNHCRLLLTDWECLIDFFCNPGLKNCWHGRPGIESTTLDLSSQSGAYDLSDTVTSIIWQSLL